MQYFRHCIFMLMVTQTAWGQADLTATFSESYTLEEAEKYAEAAAKIEGVYAEDSYEMNLRLGWLHYLAGNQPQAVRYYQKAIEVMPLSIEARLGLAYPLSALGNWEQVLKTYFAILEIDPQNSLTNYRIGLIYYNRRQFDKAYQYLEKVVNLYPFDYDSVVLFAWTNYQMGKLRESKVLFQKTLLIQPNSKSAKEGLALIK